MLDTLQFQDKDLELINLTVQDIIDSITLEDVKFFLETLGVTEIQIAPEKNYLICPTICHNKIEDAHSMKLYWYQNNKIFKCYTECNESMSIFHLYKKFMLINFYTHITDEDAKIYIAKCLKHIITATSKKINNDIDFEKYKYTTNIPILNEYPKQVLDCFIHYYHPLWLKDGITKAAMDDFNILFSISHNSVIIPQLDINGRLIGIRERVFDEEAIKEFGKYHPVTIGNINYHHLNSFTLYGIYEHKKGIQTRRSALIVEGEKSVLLEHGFYNNFSNSVAVCGNKINKYQISLLTNILGANELIIAFDKEYDNWYDDDGKKQWKILENIGKQYHNQACISFIWDYDNVLNRKDSPLDKGQEIFEHLLKTRVRIR